MIKINEREVENKVKELGYYAENSEEGYIDVYGKLSIDKKGEEHYGNIEYDCVKFLKDNGYELYRIGFDGVFVRHYAVFYRTDNINDIEEKE